MVDLLEGQGEINGLLFGKGTPYYILKDGFDPGSAAVRTQDTSRAQADGFMFGRDYLDGPEMQFTFGVMQGADVEPLLWAMENAWRAPSRRDTPGEYSVLRFRRSGRTIRYLGRGRKFDPSPESIRNDEFREATATFQLADPERYLEPAGATEQSLTMPLIAPTSNGGVAPPYLAPWQTVPNSQPRVGEVTVGGTRPAPFKIQVFGPSAGGSLSGFTIKGSGWAFTSSAVLAYDQSCLIDTRAMTFSRAGKSLASTLARGARLGARLRPGHQFITFVGGDASGSARAVVSWNDTISA